MSMETWKDEFYPLAAHDAARYYVDGDYSEADLVQHCLTKWRGLRQENLAKHGVQKVAAYYINDKESSAYAEGALMISGSTCALCVAFPPEDVYDEDVDDYVTECGNCPLYLSRGKVPCDSKLDNEQRSPYGAYTMDGDPEPMIAALEKCL